MVKKRNLIVVVVLCGCLAGCIPNTYMGARQQYYNGDPVAAEELLKPEMDAQIEKNGVNKNLVMWDMGIYRFFRGDYNGAIKSFMDGLADADALHTAGETVGAAFSSASSQMYVGDPVEISLAYFFVGLSYYMIGEYQNALIGFRRSLEEDMSSDKSRQGDLGITNYMMGESFIRTGRYDNAAVAYRRAIEYKKNLLPAYVGLYQAYIKMNKVSDSRLAGEEIKKIGGPRYFDDVKENPDNGITVIMMSGRASMVTADKTSGAFRQRKEILPGSENWKISVNKFPGKYDLYLSDKMHDHFMDQGGVVGEAKRQITRALVGAAMKEIPVLKFFAPDTDADTRYWATIPSCFYIGHYPLSPETYSISVSDVCMGGVGASTGNRWDGIVVSENKKILLVMNSFGSMSGANVGKNDKEETEGGIDEEKDDS